MVIIFNLHTSRWNRHTRHAIRAPSLIPILPGANNNIPHFIYNNNRHIINNNHKLTTTLPLPILISA